MSFAVEIQNGTSTAEKPCFAVSDSVSSLIRPCGIRDIARDGANDGLPIICAPLPHINRELVTRIVSCCMNAVKRQRTEDGERREEKGKAHEREQGAVGACPVCPGGFPRLTSAIFYVLFAFQKTSPKLSSPYFISQLFFKFACCGVSYCFLEISHHGRFPRASSGL
jgi:hypothetical protein